MLAEKKKANSGTRPTFYVKCCGKCVNIGYLIDSTELQLLQFYCNLITCNSHR